MLTQFSLNQNQNSDCVFVSLNKLVFKRVCNLKNNCPRVTLYPSCNANQSYNGMSPVSLIIVPGLLYTLAVMSIRVTT